jgi:hypothetical protein
VRAGARTGCLLHLLVPGRLEAELRLNKSLDEMVIALSVELQMQAYSLGASGAAKDGAARGGAAEGGAVKGGAAKDDDSEGGDEAILAALEDERTRRIVEEVSLTFHHHATCFLLLLCRYCFYCNGS